MDRISCHYNSHLSRFKSKFWCPGTEAADCCGVFLNTIVETCKANICLLVLIGVNAVNNSFECGIELDINQATEAKKITEIL